MESPERSPAPSSRGLKGVFSKGRRNRVDNDSNISVNGTENSSERNGLRTSTESAINIVKSLRAGDDDGEGAKSPGLAKFANKLKRKAMRRKDPEEEDTEEPRGRSVGTLNSSTNLGQSQSTLDDGESSLLTDDSGGDSPVRSPPPLLSRPSHVGYLTSSSPAIKATTIDDSPRQLPLDHHLARSATLPASTPSIDTDLANKNVTNFEGLAATSALSVDSFQLQRIPQSRSVSPGTKIKDVFKPGSRKNSTKNDSPERDRASLLSFGAGSQLGGFFNKDGRGSISSRRASRVAEDNPPTPPFIQTNNASTKSLNANLPPLATLPRTPPSSSLETPSTTVTPPTPSDRDHPEMRISMPQTQQESPAANKNSNIVTSASGNMISHRRIRSDSATHQPSKLSNSMSAPLSPMIEEKPPGTRTPSGNTITSSGFFSSVFVAAQNAANTLTNTIQNNQTKPKTIPQFQESEEIHPVENSVIESHEIENASDPPKQLAISTIGSGDLSLSQLGVTSDSVVSVTPTDSVSVKADAMNGHTAREDEAAARAEDVSAARAVSAAYGEKLGEDSATTLVAEDAASVLRTKSVNESSVAGDQTPPNGSIFESEGGLWRSGSLRSKIDKKRRHRGSSGATGTTIGAIVSSAHNTLASPTVNSSVPKLTGFAVASKKRNRDFHQLFRSVPEDDYLIEDYSCALQRDIILAGRIYISEGHICFSSNILGWVTTLIISFDEVVSVEKENTAMVFPNAIAIQTLHARHTFRSLLSREATYDLLIGIWKISHPSLKSSENGVRIENGGTGSKTEKVEPSESDDASEGSEEDDQVYDQDEEDDEGAESFVETVNGSFAGSEPPEPRSKEVTRKASNIGILAGQAAGGVPTSSDAKNAEKAGAAAAAAVDFPGPPTHAPTDCSDSAVHYEKVLKDEVIPAPLGKIYSMLFGPASGGFVSKFLLDEVKVRDLEMDEVKGGLSEENKSRGYSYIKPLNGSIGPKSTKCITTEHLDFMDLEKSVSVTVTTQTPDVPSGNVFSTKTRYCISWAPNNGTRLFVCCMIEWTGKSWLKGPIEKGANDGQLTYTNDLVKSLRAGLSSRPGTMSVSKAGKRGRKKKGEVDGPKTASLSKTSDSDNQPSNWGILEPFHSILGPIIDIIQPLFTAQSLAGFLLFLLIITWFRNSRLRAPTPPLSPYHAGMTQSQRIAAYEEIWRTEESALWDWLEERVGMSDGFGYPSNEKKRGDADGGERVRNQKQAVLRGQDGGDLGRVAKGMAAREVDWAIGVTEEKLRVLKGAVEKAKDLSGSQGAGGDVRSVD